MLKNIFKIAFLLVFLANFANALPRDKIDSTLQNDMQKAIKILSEQKSDEQKSSEIFKLLDPIFDYDLMAALALSADFKTLNAEQKEKYKNAFKANIKRSFTAALSFYKGYDLKFKGGQSAKANRYNAQAAIIIDGAENLVIFKFHDKNGNWLVYDVDIMGISVVSTYRAQFGDIFKTSGFAGLIERLESEVAIEKK